MKDICYCSPFNLYSFLIIMYMCYTIIHVHSSTLLVYSAYVLVSYFSDLEEGGVHKLFVFVPVPLGCLKDSNFMDCSSRWGGVTDIGYSPQFVACLGNDIQQFHRYSS